MAEQLLPRIEGKGRVAAYEVMLANAAIRNYIREEKTFQITTVIQTNKAAGMITMDDSLLELYQRGDISKETALMAAHDRSALEKRFSMSSIF